MGDGGCWDVVFLLALSACVKYVVVAGLYVVSDEICSFFLRLWR